MKSNKDLLEFIFRQMEALEGKRITPETAKEQSNLAKQANNSLRYELDKASLKLKLAQHNGVPNSEQIVINDLES